jgi:3-oxoacyl-[acyl-carrier-protein] synthase II
MVSAKRVVITGLGVVAPNGIGKDAFWKSTLDGVSAVDNITSFDTADYTTKIAAEVKNFDPAAYMDKKTICSTDRFAQFAISAARLAVEDSGLCMEKENKKAIGVCLGSGLGGMLFYENQILAVIEAKTIKKGSPACVPKITANSAPGNVAIQFGLAGPNLAVSTACSSGNHAIGLAADMIKQDRADIIFAGGTEAPIIPLTFGAFNQLRVMSKRNDFPKEASRPFDKDRDGFVMGEGAAILILEELAHAIKRKAHIYAELIGYGSTCGHYHMVMPAPEGRDAARAIKMALETAKILPEQVDYVNAHGTSTRANDIAETKAIKTIFKKHAYEIGISSTKSMIGHCIGAAGAIEAVACVMALNENIMPPTINYKIKDPDCDLNYVPNHPQEKNLNIVLSNSFGFGSNNACILIERYK